MPTTPVNTTSLCALAPLLAVTVMWLQVTKGQYNRITWQPSTGDYVYMGGRFEGSDTYTADVRVYIHMSMLSA